MSSIFIPEPGLLLLHVPRTGGTWLGEAVTRIDPTAELWERRAYPWLPKAHPVFGHFNQEERSRVKLVAAFVRHPIRYYESVWRYMRHFDGRDRKRMYTRWPWHPMALAAEVYDDDFNVWAQRMLLQGRDWVTRMFELYVGPGGGEVTSFIGRAETLVEDTAALLKLCKRPCDLEVLRAVGQVNTMPTYKIEWKPWLRDLVLDEEDRTIARFYSKATEDRRLYAKLHYEGQQI